MATKLWVDIESGTYGDASNIRFIEFSDDEPISKLDLFMEGSDNYRIAAAEAWGHSV